MAADKKTLRLLDANLNRACEGLRVVEDAARFLWDDGPMYRRIRTLRHRLHQLTASKYKDLIRSRESETDSGRKMKEGGRRSVSDVVSANLRRAQEAVRVLEEYSKVFSPQAAGEFKKVRYQLYIQEKRILHNL
jgi:thiamine-phosphate pyrophosphorylase